MSDTIQTEPSFDDISRRIRNHPPLPPWIASWLLKSGESITWVYGPKLSPSWERYVTHPALILAALGGVVVSILPAYVLSGLGREIAAIPVVAAVALVFLSIFVLALFNGYFTRLVVTSDRLIILQGHEVVRAWDIDDLPRSLLRFGRPGDASSRSVDLDQLTSMMGGSTSDKFTESKTILSLGKTITQIKAREKGM